MNPRSWTFFSLMFVFFEFQTLWQNRHVFTFCFSTTMQMETLVRNQYQSRGWELGKCWLVTPQEPLGWNTFRPQPWSLVMGGWNGFWRVFLFRVMTFSRVNQGSLKKTKNSKSTLTREPPQIFASWDLSQIIKIIKNKLSKYERHVKKWLEY